MTVEMLVVCIAVGAGLIALWVNVRFPGLMPWSLPKLLVHLILAFLLVKTVGPLMSAVAGSGVPSPKLTSVFAVAFPVLVYEFVVGTWLIRLAQATAGGFRA
jgi:hypothetical protein